MTVYLPDVNVIVASLRSDHPHHQPALAFLRAARESGSAFAVPVDVIASALRVLTLDVWLEPETSESAGRLISDWLNAAGAEVVAHPPITWTVLAEFARTLSLTPRSVPDALLAASAITSRSTLATFDRGFSRYPGLRVELLKPTR
ncbi:MAG: TA system VapC family ribonuclease toxin [Actinomycetes bacterium]